MASEDRIVDDEKTSLLRRGYAAKKVVSFFGSNDTIAAVEYRSDDSAEADLADTPAPSIGMLGSMAIAVNSLAGPAILQLPATYQEAGIIPTTLTLILVGLLSSFCSLHMANVVSKVPGNGQFQKEIEFSEPFRIFWGRKAFILTQLLFYLCTLCLNVAAIVDTAQVMDNFLGHSMLGADALSFGEGIIEWKHGPCTRQEVKNGDCVPFGGNDEMEYGNYLITTGYAIAALCFIPVCMFDLKENTAFQIFGFVVLLSISSLFVISFLFYGLHFKHVPMWGENFSRMLGIILFNYSLVVAIPAWLHEKHKDVNVANVVHGSTVLTTVLYILVGLGGALAIPDVNINLLAPLVSGAFGKVLRLGASFFAFCIIGLDIPLFSVLTRYNMVNSGLLSRRWANASVIYLPWAISWTFYQGNAIASLLEWGGVLFTSAVAFLLPLGLALYTIAVTQGVGSIDIYGRWIQSQRGNLIMVFVLLLLATAAVVYAIIGLV